MSITGIRAARAYVELVMNDSKFMRGLALAESEMRAFANKCTSIGTQAFGAGAAMLTPITFAVKQFKEFDDTMRLVRAVTRATMTDFQKLSDKARLLGKTTSFTSQQVADAMANLGRAGFDTRQIDGMIKHVMNLARATQTGIANSAEIVGNAMRQFGLETKDTQRVVDVLTTTANNSSQTLDDIAQSMKYAAPVAKEFGMAIEETAYYIGILANQGLKGEMAGTSLRNMLIRLSGSDVEKQFVDELQVKIRDAQHRVKNIKDLLHEANAAMNAKGWDTLQRASWLRKVFGLRAIAGGAKFLSVGDDFKNIMDAIADSEGAAERTAKQMDEGIGGAIRITISAFQELANVIGEAVSPELIQFGKWLQGLANDMITYLKYNREAVVSWVKFGSVISLGGTILFGVGGIIRTVGSLFGGLVSIGKNLVVYFKAFSKATGDVDVEMQKAGSGTRKAGNDFSAASIEFKNAAKNMLNAAEIAQRANAAMVKGGVGAERAAVRAERAGVMFETAAGHAKTATAAFASVSKHVADIGIVFSTAGTPLVNALKEFRKMISFFSKSGEAVVLAVQQIDALAGTLVRFAKSTQDAAYVFAQAAPVFSIYSRDLKTAGAAASKVLQAMGNVAVNAGSNIETLGGAMETAAGAAGSFEGQAATVVSGLEKITIAAETAATAATSVGTAINSVQQYSRPIGPTNIGGLIKQKADLEKQLAVHKDNLNNYYGTEISRVSDYLAQLRSANVPNVDEIIRTEAKLERLKAEAKKVRGSAFSIYGRSANISKQLLGEGYTTYRTADERNKFGFKGISMYQQNQNKLLKKTVQKWIEEQNRRNTVPAYTKADVRNETNRQRILRNQYRRLSPYASPSSGIPAPLMAKYQNVLDVPQAVGLMGLKQKDYDIMLSPTDEKIRDSWGVERRNYNAKDLRIPYSPGSGRVGDMQIVANQSKAASVNFSTMASSVNKAGVEINGLYNSLSATTPVIKQGGEAAILFSNNVHSASEPLSNLGPSLATSTKAAGDFSASMKVIGDSVPKNLQIADATLGRIIKPIRLTGVSSKVVADNFYDWNLTTTKLNTTLNTAEEQIKQLPPTITSTSKASVSAGKNLEYVGKSLRTVGMTVGGFVTRIGYFFAFTAAINGVLWAFRKWRETKTVFTDMQRELKDLTSSFVDAKNSMSRLEAINKEQTKTNSMLDEAATIIGELEGQYGDLGLSVDRVTKSVKGLEEATGRLRDAQIRQQKTATAKAIEETEHNIKAIRKQNSTFEKTIGSTMPDRGSTLGLLKEFSKIDVTDIVSSSGKGVFDNPDAWRNILSKHITDNNIDVSSDFQDSLSKIQKPVVFLNDKGRYILLNKERNDKIDNAIKENDERMDNLIGFKQQQFELREELKLLSQGIMPNSYESPVVETITQDYPLRSWRTGFKLQTIDEMLAAAYQSPYSIPDESNLRALRFNLANALDTAIQQKQDAENEVYNIGTELKRTYGDQFYDGEQLKSTEITNLGFFGSLGYLGRNQLKTEDGELNKYTAENYRAKLEALRFQLKKDIGSGSESEQKYRLEMLEQVNLLEQEVLPALQKGMKPEVDLARWGELATYEAVTLLKHKISELEDKYKEIEKEVDAQFEEARDSEGHAGYKVMIGRDDNGEKQYLENGKVFADAAVTELKKNMIYKKAQELDDQSGTYAMLGNYLSAQENAFESGASENTLRKTQEKTQELIYEILRKMDRDYELSKYQIESQHGLGNEYQARRNQLLNDKQAELAKVDKTAEDKIEAGDDRDSVERWRKRQRAEIEKNYRELEKATDWEFGIFRGSTPKEETPEWYEDLKDDAKEQQYYKEHQTKEKVIKEDQEHFKKVADRSFRIEGTDEAIGDYVENPSFSDATEKQYEEERKKAGMPLLNMKKGDILSALKDGLLDKNAFSSGLMQKQSGDFAIEDIVTYRGQTYNLAPDGVYRPLAEPWEERVLSHDTHKNHITERAEAVEEIVKPEKPSVIKPTEPVESEVQETTEANDDTSDVDSITDEVEANKENIFADNRKIKRLEEEIQELEKAKEEYEDYIKSLKNSLYVKGVFVDVRYNGNGQPIASLKGGNVFSNDLYGLIPDLEKSVFDASKGYSAYVKFDDNEALEKFLTGELEETETEMKGNERDIKALQQKLDEIKQKELDSKYFPWERLLNKANLPEELDKMAKTYFGENIAKRVKATPTAANIRDYRKLLDDFLRIYKEADNSDEYGIYAQEYLETLMSRTPTVSPNEPKVVNGVKRREEATNPNGELPERENVYLKRDHGGKQAERKDREQIGQSIPLGGDDNLTLRYWPGAAGKTRKEILRRARMEKNDRRYRTKTTGWDEENARIQQEINQKEYEKSIASRVGNESMAKSLDADIKSLKRDQVANEYGRAVSNIKRLEKRRMIDARQYDKDSRKLRVAERKLARAERKGDEDKIKKAEAEVKALKDKRQKSLENAWLSNKNYTDAALMINAYQSMNPNLWDIRRSFSSAGTFDAYETGGQDVSTWTAEFKEQTTILGNIEDYLATMASGEYL